MIGWIRKGWRLVDKTEVVLTTGFTVVLSSVEPVYSARWLVLAGAYVLSRSIRNSEQRAARRPKNPCDL